MDGVGSRCTVSDAGGELFRGGAICAPAGVRLATGIPMLRGSGVGNAKGARRMLGPSRFIRSGMVKAGWECMVKEYEREENSDQRGEVLAKNFFPDATNVVSHICQQAIPLRLGFFAPTPIAIAITSDRSFRYFLVSRFSLRSGKSNLADSPAAPASRLTRGRRGSDAPLVTKASAGPPQ